MPIDRLPRLISLLFLLFCSLPVLRSQENTASSVTLKAGGATIDVTLPDEQMKMSRQELLNWVQASASTVSGYYFGRFPVPHLTLKLRTGNRGGIGHGVTYPRDGGLIFVSVGQQTDFSETKDDWVLVHEMIHLAFPDQADEHHWIEEGISTYVEPVARVRAGRMDLDEMWRTFVRDLPKGEPQEGDEGLDHTHTWGRTYWGGALFCIVADVRMREQTKNRMGLEDALNGILKAGGSINDDWDIEKTLTIADKATGTNVLMNLYHETRDRPAPVDLDQLWQKLGIAVKDGKVVYNDKAPEAAVRKAITTARAPQRGELNSEIIQTFPEPNPKDDSSAITEHKKVLRAEIAIGPATTVRLYEQPKSELVYNSIVSVERERKVIAAYNVGKMIRHQQLRLVHAALLRSGDAGMLICEYEGGAVGAREGFAILRFSPADYKLHTLPLTDYGKLVVFKSKPDQAEIWSALDDNIGAAADPRLYITRTCRLQSEGYVCGPPKRKPGVFSPGDISDPGIEIRQ